MGRGQIYHLLGILIVLALTGWDRITGNSTPPPENTQDLLCEGRADILFILDSSGSIDSSEYAKELNFASNVTSLFTVGPDKIHFSAIVYSSSANVIFNFTEHLTNTDVLQAITELPYYGDGTDTADALSLARTFALTNQTGAGDDVPKLVIVITDGMSSDRARTQAEADLLQKTGAVVIAVGVGNGVDETELNAIASDPFLVFNVNDFEALSKIRGQLALGACFEIRRHEDIADKGVIEEGGNFTVTCHADIVGVSLRALNVSHVELSRMLPSQNSFTLIARYSTGGSDTETENIPWGRKWVVTFSAAGSGADNRAVFITLYVPDATFCDAGIYKCEVEYFPALGSNVTGQQILEKVQNITSADRTSNLDFSWNPDNSDIQNPYYSQHREGENIRITCRVDGPQDLQLQWMRGIRHASSNERVFSDYPYASDITTRAEPMGSNTCGAYRHTSILRLKLQETDDDTMYKCAVKENGQEITSRNLTIGVGPAKEPRKILKTNGQELTVTCDASRTLLDSDITDIAMLEIGRWTNTDSNYHIIAQYRAFGLARNREAKSIPSDRNLWQVCMSGVGNGTHNRDTMRLAWTLRDFRPEDAGTYYCTLLYRRTCLDTLFTVELYEVAV